MKCKTEFISKTTEVKPDIYFLKEFPGVKRICELQKVFFEILEMLPFHRLKIRNSFLIV